MYQMFKSKIIKLRRNGIKPKSVLVLFGVLCMVCFTNTAFSQMTNIELEKEIKALKKKLDTISSKQTNTIEKLSDRISISGLLEVETFLSKNYDNKSESDITLATMELGFDAQVADWVSGHILLLWEEDDTDPVDMDEATITLQDPERSRFFLTAGKMYVPFGAFETNMIQDPLTLEIGETRESALQIGFNNSDFYASVYTFKGDVNKRGESDRVKCYGANFGYTYVEKDDDFELDLGIDFISNIADSDTMTDSISAGIPINDYVEGFAAHVIAKLDSFTVIAEYVGAADRFEYGELDFKDKGARPEAFNIECAYTKQIRDKETTFAVGYQKTREGLALELPEERYMASVGVGMTENTSLAFEYLHDEDYNSSDGGTGDKQDMVTLQLAIEL